jgi:hypothetical protein
MDFAHKSREKLANALNNQEIATFITTLNAYGKMNDLTIAYCI